MDEGWAVVLVILLYFPWLTCIVVILIVTIIACVIHWFARDCVDFSDFFVYERGWITVFVIVGLGCIVSGLIFLPWWGTLIIALCFVAAGGLATFTVRREKGEKNFGTEAIKTPASYKCPNCGTVTTNILRQTENRNKSGTIKLYTKYKCPNCDAITVKLIYQNEHNKISGAETEKSHTKYKCQNCSANITKVINETGHGEKKEEYFCEHCNVKYTKKELLGMQPENAATAGKDIVTVTELTDFEEEYFDVCQTFNFRPYNNHTMNEVKRRYDKFQERIENGEELFLDAEGWDISEEVLDDALKYFKENIKEIEIYIKSKTEAEIKRRYEYFEFINSDDEDNGE